MPPTEETAPKKPEAPKPSLARAAESSDAAVHKLLADRQALTSSPGGVSEDEAKAKIDAIDAELAELGYSAQ